MSKTRLCFVLLLYSLQAIGQNKSIEELLNGLQSADGIDKVKILDDLCVRYRDLNPKKALEYGFEGIELADRVGTIEVKAALLNDIGTVYGQQENYTRALEYFIKSLDLKRQIGDSRAIANSLINISFVYQFNGEDSLAILYARKAQKESLQVVDPKYQLQTNSRLAYVYRETGRFNDAIETYSDILKDAKKFEFPGLEASAINNIANTYSLLGNHHAAVSWFEQRLIFEQNRSNEIGIATSTFNIGRQLVKMDQPNPGIQKMRDAIEQMREIGDTIRLARSYEAITRTMLEQKQFELATTYAIEGITITKEKGMLGLLKSLYQSIYLSYDSMGVIDSAYTHFQSYNTIKDSLNNQIKSKEFARMQGNFDTKELEYELELSSAQIANQKVSIISLITLSLLVVGILFLMVRRQKMKLTIGEISHKLKEREIEVLQMNRDKLVTEIDFKTKELTTFTLNVLHKNSLISEMAEEISKVNRSISDEKLLGVLQSIKRQMNNCIRVDEDWNEFKKYFEQVHSGFFIYLRQNYPGITSHELKVCALSRLNLSVKEKASILGISPESVKIARHRIRKKIGMATNDDFNAFFIELDAYSSKLIVKSSEEFLEEVS